MLEPEAMTEGEEAEIVGEPVEKIQGIVRCVFCKVERTQTAEEVIACKLLECCHTICGCCIDSWIDGETKECPVCRLTLNKSFLDHKILQEMVILPAPLADENTLCEMHSTYSEHYCVECEGYVCDVCRKSHNALRVTQNHTIKHKNHCLPTMKEDKPFGKFPCPKHPVEQMAIYCITCNKLTCRDCQLGDHKDHLYKFVKDMVQDNKVKMLKMFLQIKYSWTLMERAVNILEDRKVDLHEQKVRIRNDIAELGTRLHKAVDTGISRLNRNLDSQCGKLTSQMERQVHTLLKNMAAFEHTANFIEVILRRSTDTSVVYSQKFIRKHVETITANKSLPVPNPSSSEKIEFRPNVNTFIEALEKLGSIQVNKEATVPAFCQLREEVQNALLNPNNENLAFNNNDEGEKLFGVLVRKVMIEKKAEETESLQRDSANQPQSMVHVASNLQGPDSRQAQIHVATNLMDTDASRIVQQTDPKHTSWHTPQPATGMNNDSDPQMDDILNSLDTGMVEQMLRQVSQDEDVQGHAGVIQSVAPTGPPEPLQSNLSPQTSIVERNNLATMVHGNALNVVLPPVSTLAPSFVSQSNLLTSTLSSRPSSLTGLVDHQYGQPVLPAATRKSHQLGSPQGLMQQQLQPVQISQLNPIHPNNRIIQPGISIPNITAPYPPPNVSIASSFNALEQMLKGTGNHSSSSNNLFSNLDNP